MSDTQPQTPLTLEQRVERLEVRQDRLQMGLKQTT
jgi:hypothetical protein